MTDYKRMVSYMYQYEDGIKKKNVGFVRVEAKGGQCKITLHMQLLGQLDSIFPTYLIRRKHHGVDLVYLGDTVLKNQVMDSKLSADENDVCGSGAALSGMSGVLLFLNDKVFYATIWDDKPIAAQEVLEALRPGRSSYEVKRKEEPSKIMEQDQDLVAANEKKVTSNTVSQEANFPKQEEQSEEIISEYHTPRYMLPGGYKMIERQRWQQTEAAAKENNNIDSDDRVSPEIMNDLPGNLLTKVRNVDAFNIGQLTEDLPGESDAEVLEDKEVADFEHQGNTNSEENGYQDFDDAGNEGITLQDTQSRELDAESKERLFKIIEEMNAAQLNSEQQVDSGQPVQDFFSDPLQARHFFDNYPRIYPFEDNEITKCVKIEPKDIGLLPKYIWPYSNNSFLMHGFYCYHHLIFAKMKSGPGYLYILGIPGIFHGREQFMARMFGFDNFKSIKKREVKQGDFGYWYLPITLG